jgi:HupE / UreJ protein
MSTRSNAMPSIRRSRAALPRARGLAAGLALLLSAVPAVAWAHGVTAGDKGYIMETFGIRIVPFIYLGAKHMVTGYDHLLFLFGVIFYLYRLKDIGVYVTLFALGHSITLITGVLTGVSINAYLIDAVIGASVAYKALDNLGMLAKWFGREPDPRAATMLFGLCHGLGLATKMLDFELAKEGLIPNLLAFNIGVEIGQFLALAVILIAISYWRRSTTFVRYAKAANVALVVSGVALVVYQLMGYLSPSQA